MIGTGRKERTASLFSADSASSSQMRFFFQSSGHIGECAVQHAAGQVLAGCGCRVPRATALGPAVSAAKISTVEKTCYPAPRSLFFKNFSADIFDRYFSFFLEDGEGPPRLPGVDWSEQGGRRGPLLCSSLALLAAAGHISSSGPAAASASAQCSAPPGRYLRGTAAGYHLPRHLV